MQLCEWYNEDTKKLQSLISMPENYKNTKIDFRYKNIISSLKKSNNKIKIKISTNDNENNLCIRTHKFKINFDELQHNILKNYFKECEKIYNLCVDIWREYNNVTTNWQLLKDVIFFYLYRDKTKNPTGDINVDKILIIEELKKRQKQYDIETEKNQDLIKKLKEEAKEKFNNEMKIYKEKVKLNNKSINKIEIKKPRLEKIKIEKLKKPPKERGHNVKKPAPDDSLKAEISEFCTNLINAKTSSFDNNTNYEMKYKDTNKKQTITISNRAISKEGIFIMSLGKLNCKNYKKILENYKIEKECKLQYDAFYNKYYLFVTFESKQENILNRKDIVACDPGEKIFQTFYSNEIIGTLGDNMRLKILNWQKKIKKYQSALDKRKNINGKKLKNRKQVKKKIKNLYLKIKGFVNEIHKKSAKFLCENYSNIIIPEFKIKPMISKSQIDIENNKIKKINNKNEAKIELKKLNKRIKLSNSVKFVLGMQSHYRFKEYLKAYAKRYKTNIIITDEAYTSQCCTKCGILSSQYDNNREKKCIGCNYKINRDINGSRNIYLKSICSMPGMIASLANLF